MAGGLKAKRNGDFFENLFTLYCLKSNIHAIKIPTGCRILGFGKKVRMIPVKTPFDFILLSEGRAAFVDTKSTHKGTFCYSDMTTHQIDTLYKVERHGLKSGYVVYFSKLDRCVFFTASQLKELQPGKSLKPDNGATLNQGNQYFLDIIFSF